MGAAVARGRRDSPSSAPDDEAAAWDAGVLRMSRANCCGCGCIIG